MKYKIYCIISLYQYDEDSISGSYNFKKEINNAIFLFYLCGREKKNYMAIVILL